MSAGGRILLGVVAIQLISAVLILGFFLYTVRSDIDELTWHDAQEAVLRSIEATDDYFRPAETVAQECQRLIAGGVIGRDRPDQLERYLFEQLRLRQQIAGLYVGYPDGGFYQVMRSDEEAAKGTRTKVILDGPEGREVRLTWRDPSYAAVRTAQDPEDSYDPRTRAWYRAAAERRETVWTEPYVFFTSRRPGITSAAAVTGDDGTPAAVIGADMEVSEVSRFLSQISLGLGGAAFIVAPGGNVIAHSRAELVVLDDAAGDDSLRFRTLGELPGIEGVIAERILARFSEPSGALATTVWEQEWDGRDFFVAVGQIPDASWPWQIAVVVPATNVMEVARGSGLLLLGVVLLSTALACAVGYALSRSVARPLAALRRNAVLARQGNVELMEEVRSGYFEISETDTALRELAERSRRHPSGAKRDAAAQASENAWP